MQNYFAKNIKSGSVLFDAIESACAGLIYISETDSALLPFAGTKTSSIDSATILRQARRKPNEAVEEVSFERFFERLTEIKDWFGELEKARAEKFIGLQKLLAENLGGLRVYRIGRVKVEILVVGLDVDGCVMGIATQAVET